LENEIFVAVSLFTLEEKFRKNKAAFNLYFNFNIHFGAILYYSFNENFKIWLVIELFICSIIFFIGYYFDARSNKKT
jgi:hypothetical protein